MSAAVAVARKSAAPVPARKEKTTMTDINLAIGALGMFLILLGFAMEEFARRSRHESLAYNAINIAGAFFLVVYAWSLRSWPFLVLNGVWVVVAIVKILQILERKR